MHASSEPAPRLGRLFRIRIALLILILLALATLSLGAAPDAAQRERLAQVRVPFVENCGQWDERVAFAGRTDFGTAFVTQDGQLVYSLLGDTEAWSLTETFVSGKPIPQPFRPAVTRVSYFHGSDRSRWQSGLASYDEVGLGEVWPGISVALRARDKTVEKIFTVRPGADAETIRLSLDGAMSLRIDRDGGLIAETAGGKVRFTRPEAFQERGGSREPITAAYVLHGSRYGFRVGIHDPSLPIVIDPLLQSTYLGGSGSDAFSEGDKITTLAIDGSSGDVLVAGYTPSYDFPGTSGGALPTYAGGFVARLDSTLTTLIQATYLGPSGGGAAPMGIALEPFTGDVVVAGYTSSTDFPGTAGGAQPSLNGIMDGFVARLNSSLTSLLQATYLGGSDDLHRDPDAIRAIAIDSSTGDVLVGGVTDSSDFPGTIGGAQASINGLTDAFVARISPGLTDLLQATYLGGSYGEFIRAISIAPGTGDVIAAGTTSSDDLPGTAGGAQPTFAGWIDGFVARLNPTLTTLLQATYLGGGHMDEAYAVAVEPEGGDIFVAGYTRSTDLPGTIGGAQPALGGPEGVDDGFVARFDPALTTLVQSTYVGGSRDDWVDGIAVQPTTGDVLAFGTTSSPDLPGTIGGAQSFFGGWTYDTFVARLSPTLTTLLQATYLGGSQTDYSVGPRDDSSSAIGISPVTGELIVAGYTESPDFPVTAGGAQPSLNPRGDGFIARLTPDLAALLVPVGLSVDPSALTPGDGNFVLEPDEQVVVIPSWKNQSTDPLSPNGQALGLSGAGGWGIYTIIEDTISYGTIPPGAVGLPAGGYVMSVSATVPGTRPAVHWDAWFTEALDVAHVVPYPWILHVGESFSDVPKSNLFYPFVENVLHHGITAGCGETSYCPTDSVTRAQMAVLLLKAEHGSAYQPPWCTGVFADVTCPSQFADWIEQLFHEGVTGGCGGGNYCPNSSVTRAQMAALLLKAKYGSDYVPPACSGIFGDVACPSLFAGWIEQLAAEGVTAGCGNGNYCPNNPNTRGQMAAFLVKTFGLVLYGP